jgi:predicted AAA+ superfamily ATPase
MPPIYFSESPDEDLAAYAGTYLQEEIAAEGLTRNVPAFSRFLEVAALCNARLVNYSRISSDAQVARSTVQEYFQILRDTLIAHEVPAWKQTHKRKPIGTSKFYFFDTGVARVLQHRSLIQAGSPEFGEAFEHWLFHELRCYSDYTHCGEICYWRSASGFEVDFILADTTAIEVKSARIVSRHDLRGLIALREEEKLKHYIVVCTDTVPRTVDGIRILPWQVFLQELWDGNFTK